MRAMTEITATLIGATAVLLWGALALFTTYTGTIPPFQLVAMTFTLAFVLALGKWLIFNENPLSHLRQPPLVLLMGTGGLFGYHFFYFLALKNAPPVDASLIAYLWPLLIVLFSALLPGERLRWFHVGGAMLGLAGCALLVSDGGRVAFDARFTLGYMAAAACALTWSGYSVLSRRFGTVPTDAVGWFCGFTAVLGLIFHFLFEKTVMPSGGEAWLAVGLLGLGPVGIAFFTWDIGVKRGNIRALGAISYMAPLISAGLLVGFGKAQLGITLGIACLAIVGGALLASSDMLRGSRSGKPAAPEPKGY